MSIVYYIKKRMETLYRSIHIIAGAKGELFRWTHIVQTKSTRLRTNNKSEACCFALQTVEKVAETTRLIYYFYNIILFLNCIKSFFIDK